MERRRSVDYGREPPSPVHRRTESHGVRVFQEEQHCVDHDDPAAELIRAWRTKSRVRTREPPSPGSMSGVPEESPEACGADPGTRQKAEDSLFLALPASNSAESLTRSPDSDDSPSFSGRRSFAGIHGKEEEASASQSSSSRFSQGLPRADSLDELLMAAPAPVPEELVAETLRRMSLTRASSAGSEEAGPCLECSVCVVDAARVARGDSPLASGDARPDGSLTLEAQHGGTAAAARPGMAEPVQRKQPTAGVAAAGTVEALIALCLPPLPSPSAVGVADPAVLSYFQLAESIWEENQEFGGMILSQDGHAGVGGGGHQYQSSEGTFSNLSMRSVNTAALSVHSPCNESVPGSSAATTPTGNDLRSPGSAPWGARPQLEFAAGTQRHNGGCPAAWAKPLRRADPLVGQEVSALTDSACVLTQVQAADPEGTGYFHFVESMLGTQDGHTSGIPRAGIENPAGASSRGAVPPSVARREFWGVPVGYVDRAAGGRPQGPGMHVSSQDPEQGRRRTARQYHGLHKEHEGIDVPVLPQGHSHSPSELPPELGRSQTTPQHRVSASAGVEFLRASSTGMSPGSSQGGSQHSSQSADFVSNPIVEEYCGSPTVLLDEAEFPPWRKPRAGLLSSEDPLPALWEASAPLQTRAKPKGGFFSKRIWKGLK